MKSLLLKLFGVLFILQIFPTLASAEGTAQLMPPGSGSNCVAYVQGNDGKGKEGPGYGRPATEWVYVHISDPATETIYFGFTRKLPTNKPVYYQILDPTGAILCTGRVAQKNGDAGFIKDDGIEAYVGPTQIAGASSGGYNAIECSPNLAGDYAIRFNVNDAEVPKNSESKFYIHPFDVTVARVADQTAINGRLFAYRWHLNTDGATKNACMEFFTWTPDSLVVMMDMNGMQPWGFTVSFNSFGAISTSDIATNRKSTSTVSETVPEYRVFLNEPDEIVYPTGTPGEVEYIDIDGCQIDSSFCIMVNTTKIGELNVFIDLTGNGRYDEGTRDVYFPYENTQVGATCIAWDGIDGLGNPVSITESGTVIVQFLAGVVHYPVYDPENNPNGFRCAIIRPATHLIPKMYYDNRGTPIGTHNLDGCDSLCNIWTGNKGDNIMVNTWINTITSEDSEPFAMNGLCPPIAVNDSNCTRPNTTVDLLILQNDFDRDNSLDPGSVQLFNFSHHSSQYLYHSTHGYATVMPSDGDSSTMSFSYRVCDNTAENLGGPLCDTAEVFVFVDRDCEEVVALGWEYPRLHAFVRRGEVSIVWPWAEVPEGELVLERSRIATEGYEAMRGWTGRTHEMPQFRDYQAAEQGGKWYYRWRWVGGPANVPVGKPLMVEVQATSDRVLKSFRLESTGEWVLSLHTSTAGVLRMRDVLGRLVWEKSVPPGNHLIPLPTLSLPQGSGHILQWNSPTGQESTWVSR